MSETIFLTLVVAATIVWLAAATAAVFLKNKSAGIRHRTWAWSLIAILISPDAGIQPRPTCANPVSRALAMLLHLPTVPLYGEALYKQKLLFRAQRPNLWLYPPACERLSLCAASLKNSAR